MITEGRGEHAPSPIHYILEPHELIPIKERSEKQARERGYSNAKDRWHMGLMEERLARMERAQAPIYHGMVGEYIATQFINKRCGHDLCHLDLEPRLRGDGGIDIVANELTIQVKTRTHRKTIGLVRIRDELGRKIELQADVHLFAHVPHGQDQFANNDAWLMGWIWTRDFSRWEESPAWRGEHKNIEVPETKLQPMASIIKEIRRREIA